MITFTPIADSDHPHFAKELFESAFPEEERPPFGRLKKRDSKYFHFLVATTEGDDEPIGILSYWEFPEFTYIEHFAIAEELRNQGLGKAVFLNFMSQQTNQVVLEVEPSHDEMSDHRIEFYASMGFVQNPQPYSQPSYYGDDTRIPMIIMSKLPLDDDEFNEVRQQIYSSVYNVKE